MSNKDHEYKGSTFWQLILVIPGSILAFTLIISLIAKTYGVASVPAVAEPLATVSQIDENIKPVATVEVAAAEVGPHVDKSGEEVVAAVCGMCHSAGLMNAPKIGDKAQWAPRIAQGYDTLVSNAINGIRTMPARGGNPALTDGEIANAVANMANASGASFTAPAPKAVDAAPAAAKVMPVDSSIKKVDVKVVEKTAALTAVPVAEKTVAVEVKIEPVTEAVEPEKTGKEVYKVTCAMCHGTGLMNAPKLGDKEQWAPRVAQGYDMLVTHAVKGIRTMPAKGGNDDWSDKEIAGAVKYMANEADAGF
jgi:cytochrome c5